jgi:outer membrane protein assembly factor BamB
MQSIPCRLPLVLLCLLILTVAGAAAAEETPAGTATELDWPQWGGSPARNNVAAAKNLPAEWTVGEFDRKTGKWLAKGAKNVRWVARLGSECYGSPVVAGNQVFCATNNDGGYLLRYPASVDLGCLLCFSRADGRFLWQHSAEKLKAGRNVDWPKVGICCCPLVEGNRVWTVTNRGEVVCLDTEGRKGESQVLWTFDMMGRLGSVQRYMVSCSVTAAGDLLLVSTGNGRDPNDKLPAPQAPSFIALDKKTGKLVWADSSPGENLLDGQWSSPAFAVLGGVPQAIFGGGDGWLYSFEAKPSPDGKPKLLWKFDCNPKQAKWDGGGSGDRNTIVSTPVIYEGRVYLATGRDPEAGEGPGDLWCIDPTRQGDVSAEVVVDRDDQPVPHRRLQAVDKEAGEKVRANPNSAAAWHYRGQATAGGEKAGGDQDFKRVMHRSLGMPAIKDNLLVIGDFSGLVHCLDAKTGKAHWTEDLLSAVWGSPLIADGKVYLGNQDGDVVVFELGPKAKVLAKNAMGGAVYGTAAAAGDTLYIATSNHLFAVAAEK